MPNKFNESIADKITDNCSLLIFPKNKKHLNIIIIRSQILTTSSDKLLKNWVRIQAIANYWFKAYKEAEIATDKYWYE